MKGNYWYFVAMAVIMCIFYVVKENEPDRIVYLFAATFAVTHAAAEKVINAIKDLNKKEETVGKN